MVRVHRFKLGRRLEDSQRFDIFVLVVVGDPELVVGVHKIGTEPDRFFKMHNRPFVLIHLAVERAEFILNFGRARVLLGGHM